MVTMRPKLTVAAALAMTLAQMAPVHAADTPNADDIIKSLSPGAGAPTLTRGIRPAGQQPAQPATPVTTGPTTQPTLSSNTPAPNTAPGGSAPPASSPPAHVATGSTPPVMPPNNAVSPPATNVPNSGEANLTVPFASGSAAISPEAARVLDQLGEALTSPKLAGFRFRVEGHTDTVGPPEWNRALSARRAESVAYYLETRFHIDHARLMPAGMGEEGLLIATGPGVANAANRRVLVVNLGR
jgi:OmpA-OmpF porin, OOP family